MSRFGLIYKFLPRAPLLTSIVKKPVVFDIPSCSRGAKAAAKGGAKGGKKGKPAKEEEEDEMDLFGEDNEEDKVSKWTSFKH